MDYNSSFQVLIIVVAFLLSLVGITIIIFWVSLLIEFRSGFNLNEIAINDDANHAYIEHLENEESLYKKWVGSGIGHKGYWGLVLLIIPTIIIIPLFNVINTEKINSIKLDPISNFTYTENLKTEFDTNTNSATITLEGTGTFTHSFPLLFKSTTHISPNNDLTGLELVDSKPTITESNYEWIVPNISFNSGDSLYFAVFMIDENKTYLLISP